MQYAHGVGTILNESLNDLACPICFDALISPPPRVDEWTHTPPLEWKQLASITCYVWTWMPMDKKPCKKVLRRYHSRIWILLNGGNDINTCYHSVYSLQSLPLNPMKWHHVLVNIYFLSDASFGSPCLLTHVSCHHAHDSRDLILMCPISPCAMLSDGSQTMTHPHCW